MPLVLGPLLVGFLPFVAALVLVGLASAHSSVHGSQNTQSFWQWLSTGGAIRDLLGLGLKAARFVVSHFAATQLRVLSRWFMSIGTLTLGWFVAPAVFAWEAVHAIERVMHRGDPRARAKAQTANRNAIHAGHTATHANVHARSVGHALDGSKAHTNPQIRHLVHQTTIALPRDIGRVKHRERWAEKQLWKVRDRVIGLENGAVKTFEWLRDHPGSAAVGAFTGALAAVLSVAGVNALRCPQFGNLFNKRGCGLWNDLDALLGLLALGLAIDNLETLVKEAQTLEEGVAVAIKEMLGA